MIILDPSGFWLLLGVLFIGQLTASFLALLGYDVLQYIRRAKLARRIAIRDHSWLFADETPTSIIPNREETEEVPSWKKR